MSACAISSRWLASSANLRRPLWNTDTSYCSEFTTIRGSCFSTRAKRNARQYLRWDHEAGANRPPNIKGRLVGMVEQVLQERTRDQDRPLKSRPNRRFYRNLPDDLLCGPATGEPSRSSRLLAPSKKGRRINPLLTSSRVVAT